MNVALSFIGLFSFNFPVLFILVNLRFVDSLMYYALTLNVGALPGDVFINAAVSAAVEIPAQFATIAALNHRVTGRRLTCALSMLMAGLLSFCVIPFIATSK